MGILDTIEVNEGRAMKMISQLITASGGMSGLVEKFNEAGFGDKMTSWLSSDSHITITSEQIQKILGRSQIQSLASQFGLGPNQISSELATQLPKLVSKLSPEGIPSAEEFRH